MVKVKICGITNLEDAMLAAEMGADVLGFILYEKSPRYVRLETLKSIFANLPKSIMKIGVFVNRPLNELADLMKAIPFDMVQLHGDETPEYCRCLKWPYFKVFRIHDGFVLNQMEKYQPFAFLLDSFHQTAYGGTGTTFDWQIAKEAKNFGRVVLSGGLNHRNISAAMDQVRPYAVDVCSGVEAKPGKKDATKLQAFFDEANRLRQSL